ncbi:uncharacterized protein Eint_060865 [Encephalitozoon intestinalis ATCC 50506]|uniref:Uncharacterized protein n=1 Tax=Encephalitozoon intestinalis (strain ATCC 50506) TaxID=876142 RepID=W8P903_ENCIT|nr:uncharacterized protein Eint_060865 [Encephalitozoon intestinalis ATCC 50506]AHL30118.1 hypothetical protein Eint_060865 [Encephalitozoon intestinalis ATCC 50506]
MKESDRQIFFDVNAIHSSTETTEEDEISDMFDERMFNDSLGGGDFIKLEEELKKVRSIKKQ